MNPEFRRQLWLQFSTTRLVVMPLLLAASFTAVFLSFPSAAAGPMATTGMLLFAVLVLGMGTFAAGNSVMDEIADRTWDQQRMSAMQPWAMTWGKLAGASAYSWYGGALCMLVALPSAWVQQPLAFVLKAALVAVLAGILLQALLVAINLQLLKSGGRFSRRGGAWVLLLVLLWSSGMLTGMLRSEQILWWGQSYLRIDFVLASLSLFTACALVAAWRSMAEVLAVRQMPWGWPALAVVATSYASGFIGDQGTPVFSLAGLSVCASMTYFALLTEPQQRPLWQRLVNRVRGAQWRAALLQLPRWPTTLVLAMPFAVITSLSLPPRTPMPVGLADGALMLPITYAMLLARDCALALYFAFSPQTRRPVVAFGVLMLFLYVLLPWLLRALGGTVLASLALPVIGNSTASFAIAAVHVGLALWLLRRRWLA